MIAFLIAAPLAAVAPLARGGECDATGRARAAVLASFVADAASMPLHWIYNTSQVASLVKANRGDPAFYPHPSCPFYEYPFGEQSPYGQQSLLTLKVLSLAVGNHSAWTDALPQKLEASYWDYYGKQGGSCTTTKGACYRDASTKGFVAHVARGEHWPRCGANDDQANAIAHMVPVVARFAGADELLDHVAAVVRVTQNTDRAVAFALAAARILEHAILHGGDPIGSSDGAADADPALRAHGAVSAAVLAMRQPDRVHPTVHDGTLADRLEALLSTASLNRSNFEVVQAVGQSCDYPNNLLSGAHLIAQGAPTYVDAVRQRILAAGDSCSANMFNGAVFGALACDPARDWSRDVWLRKLLHRKDVLGETERLLS